MDCTLNFHFWVAVCLFFRSSAHAKRFTWKWLDFNKNVWTGDIHLVLHKDSCHRGKSQLAIGLFIHELTQGAFAFLLPLQVLNPPTFRIPLAYQSLFYVTSLRGSVENFPLEKNILIWLDSLTFEIIYIATYLFICLKHVSRCTKTYMGSLVSFLSSS